MSIRNSKSVLISMACLSVLISCSSSKLPTVKESEESIISSKSKLELSGQIIKSKLPFLPQGSDVFVNISVNPLNKIVESLSYHKDDDIQLYFSYSPNLIKKENRILGIAYTDFVNVDSGLVSLNLKSFKINKINNGNLSSNIEIEGTGNISVSGKYAGIPARIKPDVHLYLNEPLSFDISVSKSGSLILKPKPKKLILKTKISMKLLQWNIPWYSEVPLELTDMMKPLEIPIAVQSEIQFPLPAEKLGDEKIIMAPYMINFRDTYVSSVNGKIQYRANIDFIKKK